MKIVVFTSDRHAWLLRGFFHQWRKYGSIKTNEPLAMEVAGFTNPGFLSKDVPFYSIGDFKEYPVEKWSDGVIKYLEGVEDDLVMILLEDYWLIRPVNWLAINEATAYMYEFPNTIRFDVASDRMFNRGCGYGGAYGSIDICRGKGDYSLSFQASIFRRELLLEILKPGETPWESELNGTYRLNQTPYEVVGCYQWPINYAIVMNKGKLDTAGQWMYPSRTLKEEDWNELQYLGYLMPEGRHEHSL